MILCVLVEIIMLIRSTIQHFDIIGFDPRGVNNTRPMLTCFPNYLEAAADIIETEAHGYIGMSNGVYDHFTKSIR